MDTSAGDETHRKTADEDDHPTSAEPPQKRARTDEEELEGPSLHNMFEEILQGKGPEMPRYITLFILLLLLLCCC